MHVKTSRPVLGVSAGLIVAASALVATAPAHAAPPAIDGDGVVTIGDAKWQFDEYGLAYGWDAADVYDPDGYLYYPNEFYVYDYIYCGDSYPTGSVGTAEANGDFTFECPAIEWSGTGLTAQLTFRMFAPSGNGYLLRQLVTLTNETDAEIDLTGSLFAYNYEGYTGTQGTSGFFTSLGADTLAANDTGFISVNPSGASVVETEIWAPNGSAPDNGIVANDDPAHLYGSADSIFAPGETKYFVTFTHMVIPATADPEGAEAAFSIALAQIVEFASFSGRLVTGLPEGIDVVAWGTVPTAEVETPEQPEEQPELADTGLDLSGELALLISASAVIALLGALLVASARHGARLTTRSPR